MQEAATSPPVKILLTLSYDGSAYHGWQAQPGGMAVQNHVEQAFARILGEAPRLEGASRTDAGVHAHAMPAHVEIPAGRLRHPLGQLPLALNRFLPDDIRVVSAIRVADAFHARFDAIGKTYRYRLWNHPVMHPLRRHHSWHVPRPLDLDAMRRTAAILTGSHDFSAFTVTCPGKLKDPVCDIQRCRIRQQSHAISIVIRADRFLYRMCRAIAGLLVQVGEGRLTPEEAEVFLDPEKLGPNARAGMIAPAHGLILWQVHYPRP